MYSRSSQLRSDDQRLTTVDATREWADMSDRAERQSQETSRRLRQSLGARAQVFEIIKHRNTMANRLGHPVSLDEAARDWIPKFAAAWRMAYQAKLQHATHASSAAGSY